MSSLIPRPKLASESDKYDVLEKIGHGSFGVIHKVCRKSDGFILCRKEISYVRMTHKERDQLSAELSILRELRHKNIVAYFEKENFKSTQELHLYMEYCGNGDLGRYIKNLKLKSEYADEGFVWTVMAQLTTALFRCHYGEDAPPSFSFNSVEGHGDVKAPNLAATSVMILHRDLKPENIFLGENNVVKLGDFGLSKILQSQGFAETYVGTPFYMSPEICNGEKYTLYSDVWALGCIIYELCSRHQPFIANTHYALIQKIKSGKIARIPSQYSNELQQVISRCLIVNPNHRPDTVELLNHPRIRIVHKEQVILERAAELETKALQLEHRAAAIREEAENRVRRECEITCHTEHTRIIEQAKQEALRTLQAQFEAEVQRRVAQELESQVATIRQELEHRYSSSNVVANSSTSSNSSNSSAGQDHSLPSLSSTTTNQSSFDPRYDTHQPVHPISLPKVPKSRGTAFTRAHTLGSVVSLMDVSMADPSPVPIHSHLGLSPRRAISIPNLPSSLAAQAGVFGGKRSIPGSMAPSPTLSMADDDDLEACLEDLETPSRVRRSVRPVSSQPSIRSNLPKFKLPPSFADASSKPAGSKTVLFPPTISSRRPTTSGSAVASLSPPKKSPQKPAFEPRRPAPGAPSSYESDAGSGLGFKSKRGNEALLKMAMQNNHNSNIHGRTLVELSNGRVNTGGIRSSSADLDLRKKATAYGEPPMWDMNSDMTPSPFIIRSRRPEDILL